MTADMQLRNTFDRKFWTAITLKILWNNSFNLLKSRILSGKPAKSSKSNQSVKFINKQRNDKNKNRKQNKAILTWDTLQENFPDTE